MTSGAGCATEGGAIKYTSKHDLLDAIRREHEAFVDAASCVSVDDFAASGFWGDDWSLRDLFAHLTAWEQMFLRWHREGLAGQTPALPAPGYKWNQTPNLNAKIQETFAETPSATLRRAFDASFDEIHAVAQSLTEDELLKPGAFAWTGKHAVVTYLGANTASHYRTATKIVRRALRR